MSLKVVYRPDSCHTIGMNEFEIAMANVLSEGLAIIDTLSEEELDALWHM